MLSFVETMYRAENGPHCKEADFDLKLINKTARKLVQEFEIKYNPTEIINQDLEMADRVFAAGLEMAAQVGVYCRSTERIIQYSKEEIRRALLEAPAELVIGEYKDARTLYARKLSDRRIPLVFGGNAGAPMDEEMYYQTALSYIKEPLIDALDHGAITRVEGLEVKTGSPLEITATRRELEALRRGARSLGRQGMPFIAAESSATALGDIAVASPEYLRRSDIHLCPLLSELKTDYHNLSKVANFVEYGGLNGNLPNPIVGGYAGGPEATLLTAVASFMLGTVTNQAHLHLCHPVHIRYTSTTTPETMWLECLVGQSFSRNTDLIILGDIFATCGAGTKELLYEVIANALVISVSAMHLLGVAATNGKYPNASGLETRLMAETGIAVAKQGLDPGQANEIVLELLSKYNHTFGNPLLGLPYTEVYDSKAVQPLDFWLKMYDEVKNEAVKLGINFME